MARKPSKRRNRPEVDAEINLLPVLNLMVCLVPPLLLMASFIHLAVIDSSLPKIDRVAPPPDELPERIPLVLTVEMYEDRLLATCTGGINREELKNFKKGESTCGDNEFAKVEEDYAWTDFNRKIVELKDENPNDESVIIRPVDAIRYKDIVRAMDYTRECLPELVTELDEGCNEVLTSGTKRKKLLFPNVNLAFAREETGGLIQ